MLRFVLNFIFYGIIFFLIWKFQPDWIDTMRSWADTAYEIVVDLGSQLFAKIKALSSGSTGGTNPNG